jgi:addiction module HigA family antidote
VPATGAHRIALLRQIANEAYPFMFKGTSGTQNTTYDELEAVLQNTYYMKIDACRKCIGFFTEFCKDAGIPLSPQITEKQRILGSNKGIKNTSKKLDIKSDFYPSMAIPPGKYLKDELTARNISQEEFARRMGISLNAINEIINGKGAITVAMALKLEKVIPTFPGRFWLYLQSDFQIAEALATKHCTK